MTTTTTTEIAIRANVGTYGWSTDVEDVPRVAERGLALFQAIEATGVSARGHVMVRNLWDSRLAIMPQDTSCRLSAIEML